MGLMGYRRPGGGVGIRNHVAVISSVVCANRVVEMIAHSVPEAIPIVHQHGCAQLGQDREQTARVLQGFGCHSNVASVLVVGLGCETLQAEDLATQIARSEKQTEFINIQDCCGTLNAVTYGANLVAEMVARNKMAERASIDWSDIIVGLECGGSDATSGLVANPAVGWVSDKVIEAGGTVMLSETMEVVGAEHLLARRAETERVASDIYSIVRNTEENAVTCGVDIRGSQPTPGNIEGGLSTIEEKSLGCICKAGGSSIREVVGYAHAPSKAGCVFMDTPGQDIESITGMVAGGAQIVIFTTGRGTPTGCPIAPVIKITGNRSTAQRMADNMDVDVSPVLSGEEDLASAGSRVLSECIEVINGKMTRAEVLGHREFGLFRIGQTI